MLTHQPVSTHMAVSTLFPSSVGIMQDRITGEVIKGKEDTSERQASLFLLLT